MINAQFNKKSTLSEEKALEKEGLPLLTTHLGNNNSIIASMIERMGRLNSILNFPTSEENVPLVKGDTERIVEGAVPELLEQSLKQNRLLHTLDTEISEVYRNLGL